LGAGRLPIAVRASLEWLFSRTPTWSGLLFLLLTVIRIGRIAVGTRGSGYIGYLELIIELILILTGIGDRCVYDHIAAGSSHFILASGQTLAQLLVRGLQLLSQLYGNGKAAHALGAYELRHKVLGQNRDIRTDDQQHVRGRGIDLLLKQAD